MPWLVPLGPANHAKRRLRYVRGLVFEFEIEFRPEVAGTAAYIQHTVAWVYLGKVLQKHSAGGGGMYLEQLQDVRVPAPQELQSIYSAR